MEVVNVKVKHIRPRYNNLKEWIEDPDNAYIGRGGIVFIDGIRYPPRASKYANPFKISKTTSREDALNAYKSYLEDKIRQDFTFLDDLKNKKRLGCWCKPEECHGDVLLQMLNV